MSVSSQVLLHFSEDPSIEVFHPHVAPTSEHPEPYVWAVTEERSPVYWFPRDCPRVTYWPTPATPAETVERFFGHTGARRIHAIECDWLERMRTVRLFAYRMPPHTFAPVEPGSEFWVSRETVYPVAVEPVGDLLARHAAAGIELRITPSLRPLQQALPGAGLAFSMVRMRNARPAP